MKINIDLSKLPKKIVLSRKGSDSSWGGSPSLRVGNDLISLPIPEHKGRCDAKKKHLTYGDLPEHPLVGNYVDYLPPLKSTTCVHLDPDIRPQLRVDSKTPKLLFGQSAQAQKHLENQGIGKGDLFLFFGWFSKHQQGKSRKFEPIGPDQHVIWGWFQIAEIHSITTQEAADGLGCARHHPHVSHWERPVGSAKKINNTLYVATERLSFFPSLPGAGVFDWSDSRCLTSQQQRCGMDSEPTRTQWCVPSFLTDTGLTYNNPARNKKCPENPKKRIHMKSTSRGQEFVFPGNMNRDAKRQPLTRQLQREIGYWLVEVFDGVDA